jgi:hypothetical protein
MISGLVAYLGADEKLAQAAILVMEQQPAIELGQREDRRQPLVLETETATNSQSLTEWMKDLPGIEHVDVAFVHLDEDPTADEFPNQSLRTTPD